MVILARCCHQAPDQDSNEIFSSGIQKETRAERLVSFSNRGPKRINPSPFSKGEPRGINPSPFSKGGSRGINPSPFSKGGSRRINPSPFSKGGSRGIIQIAKINNLNCTNRQSALSCRTNHRKFYAVGNKPVRLRRAAFRGP